MNKYRKKPVVIDAWPWPWDELTDPKVIKYIKEKGIPFCAGIETLEGRMIAGEGDWIIKGVKGEYYPCKPDIFEATYEVVRDEHE
jgi:hypothetical protein